MAYTADEIARRALGLLGEVGLDGLTTRRLGRDLGIQGPALYYHFKNKGELLGHMATVIMRESLGAIADRGNWKRWLFDHAVATRATLLRYRDSARILAASTPTMEMKEQIMPAIAKPLVDAGFSQIDATEAVSLIANFTLGFAINEQNDMMRAYMSSVIPMERGFRHGIDALIAGIEAKYVHASGALDDKQYAKPEL